MSSQRTNCDWKREYCCVLPKSLILAIRQDISKLYIMQTIRIENNFFDLKINTAKFECLLTLVIWTSLVG